MATKQNELALYGSSTALIENKRGNYVIKPTMGGQEVTLRRGIEFDKIPRTKQPTLLKAGAEAVCRAYGVFQRYTIESQQVVNDPPSYTFIIRCDLIKINPVDGKEWVVSNGYAAGSTNEKRNGFAGCFDSINTTIKLTEKRALVCAAINLGSLSALFSQDQDNESFLEQSSKLNATEGDDAPINAKQTKRIFALAASNGYSTEEAKNKLKGAGFASTKDVKVKDYDRVCALFEEKK